MSLLPQNTDYSSRDFQAVNLRLQQLLQSAFPTWTDTDRAGFANILREQFAWVCDVLGFYQDAQAREAFIGSATLRRSMLALAKLVGYTPLGATAASVDVTFTLSGPPAGDVVFPAGTTVRSAAVTGPTVFQLLAEARIPAGTNPETVTASVEHSQNESDSFVSDDTPNQEFILGATPYLEGSAVPSATEGTYTRVENFLASTATDRHFVEIIDETGRCKLRFGNGINGRIPSGVLDIPYKTGGGVAGNVEAHALTIFDGQVVDSLGNAVVVSVDNASPASGGYDRESVESIRQLAPAALRALTRTVGRDDYETHALMVPGVARVLALSQSEDVGVDDNAVQLYLVPAGGGAPSSAIKAAVRTLLTVTAPMPTTTILQLMDPVYQVVDVFARVWVRQGYAPAAAGANIRAWLAYLFALREPATLPDGSVNAAAGLSNTRVDFGLNIKNADGNPAGLFALSDVFNAVRDAAGVLRVGPALVDFTLNGAHADVVIANNAFPALGSVSLVNGATGLPI